VILISEKENSFEKEIKEELKKKGLRKKTGLTLSGIGGIIYLINGILLFGVAWIGNLSIPYLFIGITSLVGIGIGTKNTKMSGIVILISIPISIVITLPILNFPSIYYMIMIMFIMSIPIPFLPGVFVIIGGILCLKSSGSTISLS